VVTVGWLFPPPASARRRRRNRQGKAVSAALRRCHPDGGNIIKPALSLRKKDMDAHGVKTADDIVGRCGSRDPG